MHPLDLYVTAWRTSAADVLGLVADLSEDDWHRPTDLPGWDVQDVVAHLAHLEAVLAGHERDEPLGVQSRTLASDYTEGGVRARRDRPSADVAAELKAAVEHRGRALEVLPDDPAAPASPTPGSVEWTWETLLRNRVVDMWCHEQDLRRAIGRTGGLGSAGAQVTTHTFAAGLPYVLGKKVAAGPGTSVLWSITGDVPLEAGAEVGPDGRAAAATPADPTATLTMTSETFAVLAAGRRSPDAVTVVIDGDEALGRRVLDAMTLTF